MGLILRYGEPDNRLSDFKLCIGTVCYGNVTPAYAHSLMQTGIALKEKGVEFMNLLFTGNCHVDDGRNKIVRDFLQSDCTALLFIDSDMWWNPADALCLVDAMKKTNIDVLGAIYPIKSKDECYTVDPIPGKEVDKDGFLEVYGLGTGFLCIKRRVLEQLDAKALHHVDKYDEFNDKVRKIPIIFERIVADNERKGGDYAFCWKWRQEGGKIYAIPKIKLSHVGPQVWTGTYSSYIKRKEEKPLLRELELIASGKETSRDVIELCDVYGNEPVAAPPDLISTCLWLTRGMNGTGANILECGTGLTTLAMAAANPHVMITALESNEYWAALVKSWLECYGLKNVRIIQAPLRDYNGIGWYELPGDLPLFDMVLCDGPKGRRHNMKNIIDQNLKPDAVIVFDDIGTHISVEEISAWGHPMIIDGVRRFAIVRRGNK